ncbi:hypothetical protein NDU88_000436, partial [Pleurodeles waltl]
MDCMSERLDKHAEHIDLVERRVSADKQVTMSAMKKQMDKVLQTLQVKVKDIEARSQRINLRIVGILESTNIGNM